MLPVARIFSFTKVTYLKKLIKIESLKDTLDWQISKKWCFEKYCSYDKACQFSTLLGTP